MALSPIEEALAAGPQATLAVMYHYVRPVDPALSGIVPLEPRAFRHQLELLARDFDLVDPETLWQPHRGRKPRAVVTFDDGTRDQHDHAFPILREMGIPAQVALISSPALAAEVPTMHLVHALLSQLGAQGLWEAVARSGLLPEPFPEETALKAYHYESDKARARVKYAINFVLAADDAQRLMASVHEQAVGPVARLARDWYLSEEQIRTMAAGGIRFATHAHRHLALYAPLERFVAEEIAPCERWITGLLGQAPTTYAAAFGGGPDGAASLEQLRPLLEARGYRQVLTTRPGINLGTDPCFVERIDCNRLPRPT